MSGAWFSFSNANLERVIRIERRERRSFNPEIAEKHSLNILVPLESNTRYIKIAVAQHRNTDRATNNDVPVRRDVSTTYTRL